MTPLLELTRATVVRDGNTILDIDHLAIDEGEHVAILGPNGSGKSTLIGLLTRDIRPLYREDTPPVRFRGLDRWNLFEARGFFGIVSASWQHLYDQPVTVRDVVRSGYFGSVGVHPSSHLTPGQAIHAEELLGLLEILNLADRRMDTLSTGEARRALIARALVHDPALLVLDEPTAGLDPGAAMRLRETYRRLAGAGRSLVLVTHHVEDIGPEIERVILLKAGRIEADGPVLDILTSSAMSELFGEDIELVVRAGRFALG